MTAILSRSTHEIPNLTDVQIWYAETNAPTTEPLYTLIRTILNDIQIVWVIKAWRNDNQQWKYQIAPVALQKKGRAAADDFQAKRRAFAANLSEALAQMEVDHERITPTFRRTRSFLDGGPPNPK